MHQWNNAYDSLLHIGHPANTTSKRTAGESARTRLRLRFVALEAVDIDTSTSRAHDCAAFAWHAASGWAASWFVAVPSCWGRVLVCVCVCVCVCVPGLGGS